MTYFVISTFVFALLLFFPMSLLIWTLSVRRLERKLARKLSDAELQGQLNRARFISIMIVIPFAILFNGNLIGYPK